jgi:hypothetical protein
MRPTPADDRLTLLPKREPSFSYTPLVRPLRFWQSKSHVQTVSGRHGLRGMGIPYSRVAAVSDVRVYGMGCEMGGGAALTRIRAAPP